MCQGSAAVAAAMGGHVDTTAGGRVGRDAASDGRAASTAERPP